MSADTELRELLAKASISPPWSYAPMPRHPGVWNVWGIRRDENIGDGDFCIADVGGYESHADLIVAAVNALPDLLNRVAAAEAEVERLRAALTASARAPSACRASAATATDRPGTPRTTLPPPARVPSLTT